MLCGGNEGEKVWGEARFLAGGKGKREKVPSVTLAFSLSVRNGKRGERKRESGGKKKRAR